MISERELAFRFPRGDDAVLRDAYERYSGAVFAVALSILGDSSRAADAVQATFVNAWRAASRFDPTQRLGPWLFTIARRAAIDVYRRERRVEPADPATFDGRAGDDPSFERTWEIWQVRLAIEQLVEEERRVVCLAWYGGLSHAEIANRLGVPIGTVKSRCNRAYRRLAASLAHVRVEVVDGENRDDGRDVVQVDEAPGPHARPPR